MPGDAAPLRQRVKRVPHLARMTRNAREACDLSVGRDAAARHAAYDGVDALPEIASLSSGAHTRPDEIAKPAGGCSAGLLA